MKKSLNPPCKYGHGFHRAKKESSKEAKVFKHQRKWLEERMDNT